MSRTPIIAGNSVNTSSVTIMESLFMPQTIVRSNMRIRMYKTPTNFMTTRPDSSVAGPVSTHGKIAGHKYVAA